MIRRCVATFACLLLAALSGPALAQDALYFKDDFSAANGEKFFYEGTLDERSFGYREGAYQIDTRRSTAYGQSVLTENLDSYRLEASCQLADTTDINGGGFGLSFNYREGGDLSTGSDFLLFLVYDRGAYTILRYLEGRTTVLYEPTKTRLFKAGEAVRLMVDVRQGQIRCFINGGEVASIREDVLRSGGFGLFATAQSKVVFDDFQVFAPPGAGSPPADSTAEYRPAASGFRDDFSGPRVLYDGSYNEVRYSYSGGRYVIDTLSTSYIGLSPFPQQALNFELAVDAELLEGDSTGSFGLYFRDHPSATPDKPGAFSQFRFLISPGWFAVEQSIEDRPLALAEWTQSALVRPGVNRIKVVADGGSLSFFVNDEWVYSFLDARPHTGEFGLFASAGVKVAFDNVDFSKLP